MFFEVPQYIDIEDKIAFQLTTKQLGWFALGGILIFLAWSSLEKGAFILATILIVGASVAMAFIRPYGLSMAAFISFGFFYFVKPKVYIWQKTGDYSGAKSVLNNDQAEKNTQKTAIQKKDEKIPVDDLANFLDSVQKIN